MSFGYFFQHCTLHDGVLSPQWGLQVTFRQQELASLQHAPPAGAAVSLRRRSPVGEWHGNIHSVGWRLCAHRLEGLPQDPEGCGAVSWRGIRCLQGWTLGRRNNLWGWKDCGRRNFVSLYLCATALTCSLLFVHISLHVWHKVNRNGMFWQTSQQMTCLKSEQQVACGNNPHLYFVQ